MERERKLLEQFFHSSNVIEELNRVINYILEDPKSAEASDIARNKGNDLLFQQEHHDAQTHKAIFYYYCESIALAPVQSQQLALGYADRSLFLQHICKYQDCIKDIDHALEITTSDLVKSTLLCRKVECLKRLGSSDFSTTLEIAQKTIDELEGQDKIKLLHEIVVVKDLIVNEEVSYDQEEKIDAIPVTDDYLSFVSIEYNKKYGRHLVAAKDYEPGDIIFVEKIYASAFQEGSCLSACDYCSKPTWSTVPCNYCNWSMYCSESCREKAWNSFHDTECSAISYLKELPIMHLAWQPIVFILRILITALKETAGIDNLKKELDILEQNKDVASKGLLENGKLVVNSIKNIYLSTLDLNHSEFECRPYVVPFILTALAKYTELKKNFNVKQYKDISTNENLMFLGSLLIRIIYVCNYNAHAFRSSIESQGCSTSNPSKLLNYNNSNVLSTLHNFLNHSCCPTAHWCCTEPDKLLVFALQPIKKDSQILIAYGKCFHDEPKPDRQVYYSKKYNFTCDCEACIEDWPRMFFDGEMLYDNVDDSIKKVFGIILKKVSTALDKGRANKEHIKQLIPLILQSISWNKPSPLLWAVIIHLEMTYLSIHTPKSLTFDQCEKRNVAVLN